MKLHFLVCLAILPGAFAQQAKVPPVAARLVDDRIGFRILVWQFKNDARRDEALYRSVNLKGFHIDYGEGKADVSQWAAERDWPFYVDHAAGKGILHLTPRSGLNEINRDGQASPRPWSFFDPKTLAELQQRIDRNVPPVANGPAMAIALDDEVSNGTFNSPLEVDFSPGALEAFRGWLPQHYASLEQFQEMWKTSEGELATPVTFETVRPQLKQPPHTWKLHRWLDFRTFMDETQSDVFRSLVLHTNSKAPGIPAGVVGGQQPSAYGGFDYSRLRHSLQWIESYDIGGTNEILHSFWSQRPRPGRMQTYFLTGDKTADTWFLWYYLAHGNRSVIAWPSVGGKAWFENGRVHPKVRQLASVFDDTQQPDVGVLAHPDTQPGFSPIAVLYSHPSVQVGWAIDASAHGKTWPRRSSSLDNTCLSSGKNRIAWTRLFEDLGHQPRIIDSNEITTDFLQREGIRLLVLPQCFALSRAECDAIERFVRSGGSVVADYGSAITDEHGVGYPTSPLDSLFGINRSTDSGWFNGRRFEINGELYTRPFTERLPAEGCLQHNGLRVAERCLKRTGIENTTGTGTTLFINSSPTAYYDRHQRAGEFGRKWRQLIGDKLKRLGITLTVRVVQKSGRDHGIEVLRYEDSDGREIWAIVENPTRQASVDGAGSGLKFDDQPIQIRLQTSRDIVGFKDLRTGRRVGFDFNFISGEALVLEVIRVPN